MFCANLPTEEVFTSPDAGARRGHLRLHARRWAWTAGRITGIRGELRGAAARRASTPTTPTTATSWPSYFARDRGASRLGELALVDSTSRIGQTGRTYGLTLLDENAVSHIALGSGFGGLARCRTRRSAAPRGVNRSADPRRRDDRRAGAGGHRRAAPTAPASG